MFSSLFTIQRKCKSQKILVSKKTTLKTHIPIKYVPQKLLSKDIFFLTKLLMEQSLVAVEQRIKSFNCLSLYPVSVWIVIHDKIWGLATYSPQFWSIILTHNKYFYPNVFIIYFAIKFKWKRLKLVSNDSIKALICCMRFQKGARKIDFRGTMNYRMAPMWLK